MKLRSPRVTRRTILGTAASLPAAGLLAACSSDEPEETPDGPADQVTYMTGFGLFGREGYAHVAAAKGFFAEENIEVTIESGAGGENNTQAILSGQAQFTAVDSTGVYIRHGTEQETEAVIISAVQQLPTISLISLDITNPLDLEGRTIGTSPGGITETLFPAYSELAGFDADSVQWEYIEPAQLPAALATGRVDAIALFLMGKPAVEDVAGQEAHILPYSDFMADLYGTVHIATRSFVEENPDLVRRFNRAILRGLTYAIENPAEAGELLAEAVPETVPEVAAVELELMAPYVRGDLRPEDPIGTMDEEKVVRGLAFMQSVGTFPTESDLVNNPDQVVSFENLPTAGE